jgi:hypothetical protein
MAEKKKSKFKTILVILICAIVGFVAGAAIYYFTHKGTSLLGAITDDPTYCGTGAGIGFVLGVHALFNSGIMQVIVAIDKNHKFAVCI